MGTRQSAPGTRRLSVVLVVCHNPRVDKTVVVTKLREHAAELKAAGILHLRLHGSVARGQQTSASDVDLIADLDRSRRYSLLDMVSLERRLGDVLGAPVDLSPAHMLKAPVSQRAEGEAVVAF